MGRPLIIGTRGSVLALAQTQQIAARLAEAHPALAAEGAIERVIVVTTGDREQTRVLADIGGKGLFTKEIDEALLAGRIDLAVNSAKDLPTWLPDGLCIACVPAREDYRDAFISPHAATLDALPKGAVLGTSSPRRAAQVLARRPDLVIRPLRGNVDTRLKKLTAGEADATLLAMAGLNRLGLSLETAQPLPPDVMLPASGQGALAITCRTDDQRVRDFLAPLHVASAGRCLAAERAVLAALDGSCRTPIGALCEEADGTLRMRALVARLDGTELLRAEQSGPASAALALGRAVGEDLLGRAGSGFFEPDSFAPDLRGPHARKAQPS